MLKKYNAYITWDGVLDMSRMLVTRFRNNIEQGTWEEEMKRTDRQLRRIAWVIIILAALYFFAFCFNILTR